MIFQSGQHIHVVGIGGTGMSAIARVLLERGYVVSGSDRAKNDGALALERDGATVYSGHMAENITGADMLIVSSAVPDVNPEIAAAREQNVPIYKRQQILSHLMTDHHVVAVAGTHGKTTTTAMVVHLLRESGFDPGYIVGGIMANTGTNAASGTTDTFVIEADEYDNAFLGLYPEIAVVTNIEHDHPDFFKTEADLTASFQQFVIRLPRDHGILIACADDVGAMALAQQMREQKRLVFTYGLGSDANLRAENIITEDGLTRFDVVQGHTTHGPAALTIPGQHNVQNALAALYVAGPGHDQALSDVIPHLKTFKGTGRRFDVRADRDGVAVIDDYAHHPTAIRTTIDAARSRYPDRALWVVWQPHTYSRTQTLWADYLTAFDGADHLLVTDVYAAREQPVDGINSAALIAAMQHSDARHTPLLATATQMLLSDMKAPAVLLILSAGDAPQIGSDFLAAWGRS